MITPSMKHALPQGFTAMLSGPSGRETLEVITLITKKKPTVFSLR
jgi:hypothetical protein